MGFCAWDNATGRIRLVPRREPGHGTRGPDLCRTAGCGRVRRSLKATSVRGLSRGGAVRSQRAFTLLEMLMVVAIIGVLAAMLWPDFLRFSQSRQLDESADRLRTLIGLVRAHAMNEARSYRLLIRQDGTLRLERQLDAVLAPETFVRVRSPWARIGVLQPDVWIESVTPLPEGPAPIEIVDDQIEFPELDEEVIAVEELDEPQVIEFRPDGTSDSLRWTLRAADGRGVVMTLDGRLGRVTIEPAERVDPQELRRPEPIEEEPSELDQMSEQELLDELRSGP